VRRTRLALLSVATGATLAFGPTLPAAPASGSVAQQTCDNTSTTISATPPSPVNGATNVTLTAHVADLDQTPLTPVGNVQFYKDSTLIGTPAVDGSGNATTNTFMSTGFHTLKAVYSGGTTNNVTFCRSSASTSYLVNGATPTTTTPVPTTTVPPPVGGVVTYPSCAAAFRAGVHDIPSTDPRYRLYLDLDRDGIACELNGNDNPPTTIVRPPGSTTIIKPPPSTTVVTQPPATNTIIQQPPAPPNVIVMPPPANTFITPQAPSSGAVATGDGTMARAA